MSKLGVIGGSGIYQLDGIKKKDEVEIPTPFGSPSSPYIISEAAGKEIVFLPRHGINHQIPPSSINYQANIYGMKKLGVSKILSVSACGSLREEMKPLDFVIPNQFIDRAPHRKNTFFENEIVVHAALAEPICKKLAGNLLSILKSLGLQNHKEGVYLNMEGPQFSTKAESNLYRSWGADIIGMTNFTEAKLAREAEICYVSLSAVTDFDCWHPEFGKVDADSVLEYIRKNSQNSKKIIKDFILKEDPEILCACQEALRQAIVTKPENISSETKEKLGILINKYLK